MSKFAKRPALKPVGPMNTVGPVTKRTFEGAPAYAKDVKTELFTLAVTSMVSEATFYESAKSRDSRLVRLVQQATQQDPQWVAGFVGFLRNGMYMRSASIVVAAEYVAAGGANGRQVIADALQRADEPAEMLAYWHSTHGRKLPAAVKRGVADAAKRLYDEYSAPKYDRDPFRVADVLSLVHPRPVDAAQGDLFKYMLDKRYDNVQEIPATLPKLQARERVLSVLNGPKRAEFLTGPAVADELRAAGLTWENLAGTGTMDARAWEAIIPSMGYMALLRNLRNFEQAGIGASTVRAVSDKLADPGNVRHSKQFPYRFWSAYKQLESNKFKGAIEAALDVSVENIPSFDGNTLTLVDTSGSMGSRVSARSTIACWEIGALFGAAFALKNSGTLVEFADTAGKTPVRPGQSVLTVMESIRLGKHGYGTDIFGSVAKYAKGHDRLVLFSDMQTMDASGRFGAGWYSRGARGANESAVDGFRSVYSFDLTGYDSTPIATGNGRYMLGGWSDKVFTMMPLLERTGGTWPWE